MRTKLIFWMIVFLSLSFLVSGEKVVQTGETGLGDEIQIVYPKEEWFTQAQNFTLNFGVHNSSGGRLNSSQVSCVILVSNITGGIVDNGTLSYDENRDYFYYNLDQSNYIQFGDYPYYVYCESDEQQGFLSTSFTIGRKILNDDPLYVFAFVLGVCLVAGLLVLIGNSISPEHFVLKLSLLFFSFSLLLLVPASLMNGIMLTADNFFSAVVWMVRLFGVYIFLYFNYSLWLKAKLIDLDIIKSPNNLTKK